MIYPRKTPQQAKKAEIERKLAAQVRRNEILALVSPQLVSKKALANIFSSPQLHNKTFAGDQHVLTNETILPATHKTTDKMYQAIRDDRSEKSEDSRMSGASDDQQKIAESQLNRKMITIFKIPPGYGTKKVYNNEEEEWAEIYKHNQDVYKAEMDMEKQKKVLDRQRLRDGLDEQIKMNQVKKMNEVEKKRLDHEFLLRKMQNDDARAQKKKDLEEYKRQIEDELRLKQIKDNRAKKKHDLKERKDQDKMLMNRIRQEQEEEDRLTQLKREEDLMNYRKLLKKAAEKRQQILEEKDVERKLEMMQIQAYNKKVLDREKARELELKEKDERIRKTLEIAREQIGKPKDERERMQDEKVRKWMDKKDQDDKDEEKRRREENHRKQVELKNFFDQQVMEKKQREAADKANREDQARLWQESKMKQMMKDQEMEEEKRRRLQDYTSVLSSQMQSKLEKKMSSNKFIHLRSSLNDMRQGSL